MKCLALLALSLTACRGADSLQASLPSDTAYVALIEQTEEGITSASQLVRYEGQALPLVGRKGSITRLLSWTESDLAQVQLSTAAASAPDERLREAPSCQPSLPAPSWVARWEQNSLVPESDVAIPSLTADWLQSACDPSWEAPLLRFDCSETVCDPQITLDKPCQFRIDLQSCGLGEVTAQIAANGDVCFEPSRQDCSAVDDPLVQGRFDCSEGRCSVEGFVEQSQPSPFEFTTTSIIDREPYIPNGVVATFTVFASHLRRGYLWDLVVLADEIIVSSGDESFDETCPRENRGQGIFHFLDPDTLAVSRTAPAPPCAVHLKPDPVSDGFIAVYSEQGNSDWYLGRFTKSGQLVQSVFVDDTPDARVVFARDLAVSKASNTAYLLTELSGAPPDAFVSIVSLDSFVVQDKVQLPDFATAIETLPNGDVVTIYGENRNIRVMDATLRSQRSAHEPLFDASRQSDLSGLVVDPVTQTIVVATQGAMQALLLAPPYTESTPVYNVGLDFEAHQALPWPGDPELMFMAGNRTLTFEGMVGLIHLPSRRYLYPMQEVGPGAVTEARTDGRGGVLLLLPWTADIVRVRPRG